MTTGQSALTEQWNNIKWVLTDVDDTLTWQGKLPPEALIALNKLQQAGIKVIAVTGACAGWCDHIAQLWPVDAVLGENGAFILEKKNGYLTISADLSLDTLKAQQSQLKEQVLKILMKYPDLNLTLDQAYRLCEVSIDIGQNRPRVDNEIIEEITFNIQALGAHATSSSIHINAWYGEHSKKATSFKYLNAKGLTESEIAKHCCYIGDSMNDQAMFQALPLTAGVANISHYWDKLHHHPSVVMENNGGYGFSEFTEKLLTIKCIA
ncbi:HAD-IIB family hydrolase [Reinekea marina]|uniref:HAD-IIB family hydrolase n=1 Tax=Reinekea marina TaxID=1310421 RepID=A0ABV7WUM3_9GAMM|nr:HAD-IIB family hydrolase [Reinekea marina]MDN3649673.1 HAD-IIB family hydrolase [Reinekea marina]